LDVDEDRQPRKQSRGQILEGGSIPLHRDIELIWCPRGGRTSEWFELGAGVRRYHDREDASSMVTAGATANTTVKNSRASRESGLLCSHSHGESIRVRVRVRVNPSVGKKLYKEKGLTRRTGPGGTILISEQAPTSRL